VTTLVFLVLSAPLIAVVSPLSGSGISTLPAREASAPARPPAPPVDTIRIDIGEAFRLGIESSPELNSVRWRSEAASSRASQARAWPNPTLLVTAENVGQQSAFTGLDGVEGVEGQVVLRPSLPFGAERTGSILVASAEERSARAGVDAVEHAVRVEMTAVIAAFIRDRALVRNALEEWATLSEIADAIERRAQAGRSSAGDAARAELARGLAGTRLARRQVALGQGTTALARMLGQPPETEVELEVSACRVAPEGVMALDPSESRAIADLPALRIAESAVDAARGSIELARGVGRPDIHPEVGLRRTGGQTGLYLGIGASVPIFDRGRERVEAARAELEAASAERLGVERRWEAARHGAAAALGALERAGSHFDNRWFASLDVTVAATDARYRVGEGTLFELLDSRRARLEALDDYHAWQAEWWIARAELARAQGRAPGAETICVDPYREALR